MTMRTAAEVFSPGEYLRDELEARGWSQAEFADILGRSAPVVNQIINAKRIISPEIAKELAAALDTSPEVWLNLEAAYRLYVSAPAPERIGRKARLRSHLPVRDILARGWVEPSENDDVLEERLLSWLKKKALDAPSALPFAAKQTHEGSPLTPVQEAWLVRVKQLAEAQETANYSPKALDVAIGRLERLLGSPEDVREVPRVLSDAGVRFVVVEQLPGLKLDGVCFWLDARRPVVGMSLRFDRIDNFWFVLRHELEHVMNGDGLDQVILDSDIDLGRPEVSAQERNANAAAANFCVPRREYEAFLARKGARFTDHEIRQFARTVERHPGLVAGQLRRSLSRWDAFGKHLAKVRPALEGTALVDGFGHAPRIPA